MNTTNPASSTSLPHAAKILVVDDDIRLRDLLRRYLSEQGFNVVTAEHGQAMNKLWLRERYDLLVLDLMLPGEDGLAICRRLRGAGDLTPIIMLTAKGEDVDRIIGLEMGADDYLAKPFSVLKVFARHARQPLSREKLMELARGREYEVFDRSLDVQISRLRKLIEPDPSNPLYIQTVWGLGYVFIPEGQPR